MEEVGKALDGTKLWQDEEGRILMELLPEKIQKQLLPMKYIEDDDLAKGKNPNDLIAVVKYFTPYCTWYGVAYNPGTGVFFGLVQFLEEEFGYFSLDELATLHTQVPKGSPGYYFASIPVERDICFKPTPLGKLRRQKRS